MTGLAFSLAGLAAACAACATALHGQKLVARRDAASVARARRLATLTIPAAVAAICLSLTGIALLVTS